MSKKNKAEKNEPQFILSPLNNPMINYKVYYMSTKERIVSLLLIFVIGGIAGYIFYGGLFKSEGEATLATHISNLVVFCLVGGIAIKAFFPSVKRAMKAKRDKKHRKQFMDMLECLSSSLSAGNTVNDSFVNAKNDLLNQYTEKDYIIIELSEVINGIDNGKTLEEMILAYGKRSDNKDIDNFSNVISNCYRMGGDFKNVVRKTRDIISDKIAIEDEIQTKISSNKLQLNAMCIMPLILVGMLKISSSGFAENLSSGLGVVVTTIAIALFIAAYFWGQKIIDIK